jgi:hypothetical protein
MWAGDCGPPPSGPAWCVGPRSCRSGRPRQPQSGDGLLQRSWRRPGSVRSVSVHEPRAAGRMSAHPRPPLEAGSTIEPRSSRSSASFPAAFVVSVVPALGSHAAAPSGRAWSPRARWRRHRSPAVFPYLLNWLDVASAFDLTGAWVLAAHRSARDPATGVVGVASMTLALLIVAPDPTRMQACSRTHSWRVGDTRTVPGPSCSPPAHPGRIAVTGVMYQLERQLATADRSANMLGTGVFARHCVRRSVLMVPRGRSTRA